MTIPAWYLIAQDKLRCAGVVDLVSGDSYISHEVARKKVLGEKLGVSRVMQRQVLEELISLGLVERVNHMHLVVRK